MTPKQYLAKAYVIDEYIDAAIKRIEELRAKTQKVNTVINGAKPTNFSPSDFGNVIAEIDKLEREINKNIKKYKEIHAEIISRIMRVENPLYQKILIKRYIKNKDLKSIAKAEHYNYSYIRRCHGCALKEFKIQNQDLF